MSRRTEAKLPEPLPRDSDAAGPEKYPFLKAQIEKTLETAELFDIHLTIFYWVAAINLHCPKSWGHISEQNRKSCMLEYDSIQGNKRIP